MERWKWQEDEEEDVGRYWMTLRTGEDTSFEGGSSRSHYTEESFWRRLWTCRQTEYWMNEAFLIASLRSKCLTHLIPLDMFSAVTFPQACELWSCSIYNSIYFSVTLQLVGPITGFLLTLTYRFDPLDGSPLLLGPFTNFPAIPILT